MENNGFTPTQQALLAVLADGYFHPRSELEECINDDLSAQGKNLTTHLCLLRKKLRLRGQGIVCERGLGSRWRLVRLLASSTNGKR